MTTGSLGQGTSLACGMALGDRLKGRDSRTFLILGAGESNEGQVCEVLAFASAKKLSNLVVLLDWNKRRQGDHARCLYPGRHPVQPFHYEAYCLLAPRETEITLTALEHSEVYIQKTVNPRTYPAVMCTPQTIQTQHAGANGELLGCMQREIKTFFDYDNAPFSNMVLGEVLNYPGKWSSYPPHHHPQPEVYFYRFDHPQGFDAGFGNGEIYRTGHNGISVINSGFHSQTAGADGKSGGLKPFSKEGNWPVRSDVECDWNPATLEECGTIESDLEAIYNEFIHTQNMWTYWLDKNPNIK